MEGVGCRGFKKAFRSMPDPRAENARHDLWSSVHCAGSGAVRSGLRARRRRSSDIPRKGVAALLDWNSAFRATIRSAGYSVCSSRKPSRPHSAVSWRRLRRPTGSNSPAWWLSTGRPCAAPTSAAGGQRRCNSSMSLRWTPAWPGGAQSSRSQRDRGAWSTGSAVPRGMHRHRRCTPLSSRLRRGGARAQRRLCAGDQGQPRAPVQGRHATVRPIRHAQRRPTDRTVLHDRPKCAAPPSWQYQLGCVHAFPASPPGPDHFAPAQARPAGRSPVVRHYLLSRYVPPKRLPAGRTQPLGHPAPAPLGARRQFRRGRKPSPKGQCSRELRDLAKARPQHPPSQPYRTSIRRKIKRAGWDDTYLMATLSHMR